MKYILKWKDLRGREWRSKPETWENIEHVLHAIYMCKHYQDGSFRLDWTFEE